MGWWASEDGKGRIGDRPADILGTVLADSLGDRFDTDLLAGFLAALGAALLRNSGELISDGRDPRAAVIVIALAGYPAITVPIREGPAATGLEEALFNALEVVAFQYRVSEMARAPTLAEILETAAFVARGHIHDPETGEEIELARIHPRWPPAPQR